MRLTEKVHLLLTAHLQPGDHAIDATAGNGHDTLFLAQKVGPSGKVIAIDIQATAIQTTQERLVKAHLGTQVDLEVGDHAKILDGRSKDPTSEVSAITFNLGYLPGSDHSIQTQAERTLPALEHSLSLLKAGGLLCVTAYRGHAGGQDEADRVEEWMRKQQSLRHVVESYVPESLNNPPILWVLKKESV